VQHTDAGKLKTTTKERTMSERNVEIIVAERLDGNACLSETVEFTDNVALKQAVDELIERSGFRKISVELVPSWETTEQERQELSEIEDG